MALLAVEAGVEGALGLRGRLHDNFFGLQVRLRPIKQFLFSTVGLTNLNQDEKCHIAIFAFRYCNSKLNYNLCWYSLNIFTVSLEIKFLKMEKEKCLG